MKVYCDKYPELFVRDLKVKFKKGVANVKDKAVADKLVAIKGFGIKAENITEPPKGK